MNKIKFRTWDSQNKEFSEWTNRDPFFSTSEGKIFFWERVQKEDGSYSGDIILNDHGDRFTLQQFTGLVDKNDKEVYIGDIVKWGKADSGRELVEVRWSEEGHDNHPCIIYSDSYSQGCGFEVVGNIFDNK